MLIAYTYKLDPSRSQTTVMEKYVEMLRLQYNFRIREIAMAYEQASCPVLGNYCDIKTLGECCPLACSVSKQALYSDPWAIDKKTGLAQKRSALAQLPYGSPKVRLTEKSIGLPVEPGKPLVFHQLSLLDLLEGRGA